MDHRRQLLHYLERTRGDVLRAVAGVDEFDARRALTPSGTNLLGLVKHLATVENGYVRCTAFPSRIEPPWADDESMEANAELWLTPDQTADEILDLYAAVALETEDAARRLPPDAPATVRWWREPGTTFDRLLVHLVAETAQHAGHLEILREGLDGQGDRWDERDPDRGADWHTQYRRAIDDAAEPFRDRGLRVRAVTGER